MKSQDQKILIETPSLIELEGTEVLTFITRENNCVVYKVLGFDEIPVKVVDYRQRGLESIDTVLSTKEIENFAENFCYPAWVRISETEQEVLLELLDLVGGSRPELMLWIATGIEDPIPDYEYPFFRIAPLTNSSYSFVSIFNYHRFQDYFDGMMDRIWIQVKAESQI